MGKFGWSYPAGCSGTPYDEPCGCDLCGNECDSCTCPECPVCGECGNAKCYEEHGLVFNAAQRAYQADRDAKPAYDPMGDGPPLDF